MMVLLQFNGMLLAGWLARRVGGGGVFLELKCEKVKTPETIK
jgi:hypothetical protein